MLNTVSTNNFVKDHNGNYSVTNATPEELVYLASEILLERINNNDAMTSPDLVRSFLKKRLALLGREVFAVMFLDNKNRLISFETLFAGTFNAASVHPREVVKRALDLNAAAVIFAHNHPTGNPEPSSADKAITKRLTEVLDTIDVRTLDHIIAGKEGTFSFAEKGLI